MLTALSVSYSTVDMVQELSTQIFVIYKIFNFFFSLHLVSVIFVTSTSSLKLSNCDTALATNSVSLKDLSLDATVYTCISKQRNSWVCFVVL